LKLKLLLLTPLPLLAKIQHGLASNFTKGLSETMMDLFELINPVIITIGVILVIIAVYQLFLDDNPQNRGITSAFGSFGLLITGFVLISLKYIIGD
jgi:hypothetical protein